MGPDDGGVRFFDESGMVALLEETRGQLEARNSRLKVNWGDATLMDLERDDELMQMIKSLFDRFEQMAPMTHSIIAKYIRSHPGVCVIGGLIRSARMLSSHPIMLSRN